MPGLSIRKLLPACCLYAAQALAHPAPTALQRAQLDAHERHLLGVGVLVLGHDLDSQRVDALMHSGATRFALRKFDLVVLRPASDGRYAVQRLGSECPADAACAQDEFLRPVSAAQARALAQGRLGGPVFVVYPASGDARPSGVAYGFDGLESVQRFADAVRHASPAQPARFEDRLVLSSAP
jgi:hypothetical protein